MWQGGTCPQIFMKGGRPWYSGFCIWPNSVHFLHGGRQYTVFHYHRINYHLYADDKQAYEDVSVQDVSLARRSIPPGLYTWRCKLVFVEKTPAQCKQDWTNLVWHSTPVEKKYLKMTLSFKSMVSFILSASFVTLGWRWITNSLGLWGSMSQR